MAGGVSSSGSTDVSTGYSVRILGLSGLSHNTAAALLTEKGIAAAFEESKLTRARKAAGIPREAIPEMARAAMQVTRLLKNNLQPLTEPDAIRIYETTY